MSPASFGWWAVGLAAAGTAAVGVARYTGAAREGFVRREVPAAVLSMSLIIFLYTFEALRWSNERLDIRLGEPDRSLRSVEDLIQAPMDAARALRGPMIAVLLLAGLAFFFASTPEEREANRKSRRYWFAALVALVGFIVVTFPG